MMANDKMSRIEGHHFPTDSPEELEARLAGYLAEGHAVAGDSPDADAAALAYAYHLAYAAIADRLAVQAASISGDGYSKSTAAHQIAHFQKMADDKLSEFRSLTAPAAIRPVRVSRSARIHFRW